MEAVRLFRLLDADGNGAIEVEELLGLRSGRRVVARDSCTSWGWEAMLFFSEHVGGGCVSCKVVFLFFRFFSVCPPPKKDVSPPPPPPRMVRFGVCFPL